MLQREERNVGITASFPPHRFLDEKLRARHTINARKIKSYNNATTSTHVMNQGGRIIGHCKKLIRSRTTTDYLREFSSLPFEISFGQTIMYHFLI